ncbi:PTS sugar transporter subunit IIC [Clostridium polynesiense]|uniref:PTS sugar transporter subunit IIC n=1 Tax=Clostridium polynesiense TaxID=1325933 RepID=UPI000590DFE8|nr:PTS sugar transporter subunit IIC [Clostridium polynesiense]
MLVQSFFIGILYFFCRWTPNYTFLLEAVYKPTFLAVIIGLIMGDVKTACIIGAYLQAVYLGLVTNLGGVATIDKGLGSCIVIPLALATGMSPELAVSFAIPFGLLGTLTINLSKVYMSFIANMVDKVAEQGNAVKVRLLHLGGSAAYWVVFGIIPVTLIVYLGPNAVSAVINLIPQRLVTGLTVAGGLMPALGFAMTVRVIGRKDYLPFFFLGFFLVKYFELPSIGCAIFAAIAAVIYIQLSGGKADGKAAAA